jgi:hypothetical protein
MLYNVHWSFKESLDQRRLAVVGQPVVPGELIEQGAGFGDVVPR